MLNVRDEGDRVQTSRQRLKGENGRPVGLHLPRLEVFIVRAHLVQLNLRLGVDANGGAGDVEAFILRGGRTLPLVHLHRSNVKGGGWFWVE